MDITKQKYKFIRIESSQNGNPNNKIDRLGRLTMSDRELWKLFEKTGSINDYLNYACTCESEIEDEEQVHDGCHKEDECFE